MYLQLLEDISRTAPVTPNPETYGLLSNAAPLGVQMVERKMDHLYNALLKDCHAM